MDYAQIEAIAKQAGFEGATTIDNTITIYCNIDTDDFKNFDDEADLVTAKQINDLLNGVIKTTGNVNVDIRVRK